MRIVPWQADPVKTASVSGIGFTVGLKTIGQYNPTYNLLP